MSPRAILRMAKPFRAAIGAHQHMIGMIGSSDWTVEEYQQAECRSVEAVATAKYLIQHLDNRHDAVLFARAVGMPGYINLR